MPIVYAGYKFQWRCSLAICNVNDDDDSVTLRGGQQVIQAASQPGPTLLPSRSLPSRTLLSLVSTWGGPVLISSCKSALHQDSHCKSARSPTRSKPAKQPTLIRQAAQQTAMPPTFGNRRGAGASAANVPGRDPIRRHPTQADTLQRNERSQGCWWGVKFVIACAAVGFALSIQILGFPARPLFCEAGLGQDTLVPADVEFDFDAPALSKSFGHGAKARLQASCAPEGCQRRCRGWPVIPADSTLLGFLSLSSRSLNTMPTAPLPRSLSPPAAHAWCLDHCLLQLPMLGP